MTLFKTTAITLQTPIFTFCDIFISDEDIVQWSLLRYDPAIWSIVLKMSTFGNWNIPLENDLIWFK